MSYAKGEIMAGLCDMFDETTAISPASAPSSYSPSQVSSGKLLVLSAGGSIFFRETPDVELIRSFASALEELCNEGCHFAIVVGGGSNARRYCKAAKTLGLNNFLTDLAAIQVTKANAILLSGAIKNSSACIDAKLEKAKELIGIGKIPVYGGILPSLTTDSVAALLAESLGATFVNLTNVDGIYSADPSKDEDAEFYERLDYSSLIIILRKPTSKPGQNFVLDLPCALILRRSGIRAAVLKGDDFENFKSFIRGYSFRGTTIESGAEDYVSEAVEDEEIPSAEEQALSGSKDLEEVEYPSPDEDYPEEVETTKKEPRLTMDSLRLRKKIPPRRQRKKDSDDLKPENIDF